MLNKKLISFGLKRNSKFNIGKTMGENLWLHKNYSDLFISKDKLKFFTSLLPFDFDFDVIRFNLKKNEICFIKCIGFDELDEPILDSSYKITEENDNFILSNEVVHGENPLIFHHKWMFVLDDYQGFDVEKSKLRSILWKGILGKNKEISSKIGRFYFWRNWLKNNNLESIEINSLWDIYFKNLKIQEISSSNTARLQVPKTFKIIESISNNMKISKLLDIGCGSKNSAFSEKVRSLNINYYGCDPFNKSKKENMNSILKCMNGQSNVVTLNNVLNTIKEPEVRKLVLEQAKNALSDDGILIMCFYEGSYLAHEDKTKPLTPTVTRDGWQNRFKTEEYETEVKSVFEYVVLKNFKGSKFLIASKNNFNNNLF